MGTVTTKQSNHLPRVESSLFQDPHPTDKYRCCQRLYSKTNSKRLHYCTNYSFVTKKLNIWILSANIHYWKLHSVQLYHRDKRRLKQKQIQITLFNLTSKIFFIHFTKINELEQKHKGQNKEKYLFSSFIYQSPVPRFLPRWRGTFPFTWFHMAHEVHTISGLKWKIKCKKLENFKFWIQ